jgi:DNA gyrase/topoisomerase IV subunit A
MTQHPKQKKMFTEEEIVHIVENTIKDVTNTLKDQHVAEIENLTKKIEELSSLLTLQDEMSEESQLTTEGEKNQLTDEQTQDVIAKLETEHAKSLKEEEKWVGRNNKKYFECVNVSRKIEEKLHELKGGNVDQLIKEKYNGFSTTGLDISKEHVHRGIEHGAYIVSKVLSDITGIPHDVEVVTLHTDKIKKKKNFFSKTIRKANCFRCDTTLVSETHVKCPSCNWLLCNCGACGCSYQKY